MLFLEQSLSDGNDVSFSPQHFFIDPVQAISDHINPLVPALTKDMRHHQILSMEYIVENKMNTDFFM